jgi:sialic acid synthase SpsE
VLEAARRVTNWDPEDAEALERLDVKLMEVGSIELDRVKIVG